MRPLLRDSLFALSLFITAFSLSSCGDDDPIAPVQKKPLLTGPSLIDFHTLYAGECQDTTITYNNTAATEAIITTVQIDGSEITWVGATLPVTVAAGASMDLHFRACTPSTGALNRKIMIRSATDSIVLTILSNVVEVKRAPIGVFYAQPDLTLPVFVNVRDSVLVSGLVYGQYATALAPVGERRIVFQATSGTELAASDIVQIDSASSLLAIYSGIGVDDEVIAVSTPRGTAPAAPLVGVRFIHASKNAPSVRLHLEAAAGPTLTQTPVSYGTSNNAFTVISANTTALVVVDDAGTTLLTLPLTGADALTAGKLYTVVMYGNASENATANRLTARILLDPGQ